MVNIGRLFRLGRCQSRWNPPHGYILAVETKLIGDELAMGEGA